MTRATLLSLLAHPAALSAPDVRALEELALAFPYCQTAHLLLAKAAHDQDSMLAAQRLRRAATYAADRTRLRQLIELPALLATSVPATVEVSQLVPISADALPEAPQQPDASTSSNTLSTTGHSSDLESNAALEDKPGHIILPVPAAPVADTAAEVIPAASLVVEVLPATAPPAADVLAATIAAPPTTDAPVATAPPAVPEPAQATAAEAASTPAALGEKIPAVLAETSVPSVMLDTNAAAEPAALAVDSTTAQLPEAVANPDPGLPAQAPPIRPPVTAEAARFEFGLAASEAAELTAYCLPELEPIQVAPPTTPRLPPFSGAPDICYVADEGSRLGFCLVPVAADPAALPGSTLPPTGEFFAPDALLLDYLAALPPTELPKPSSLDLINSFLQRAPLASRRRAMPSPAMPDPEAQADLSLPSTRVEFDLVSENLAAILARQGKNERAIAVYERLMAKYPEKITYFAAQIESLRP